MPFITQGRTNIKYILIVVVLAAIAGGGILGYYYLWIKDLEARLAVIEIKMPEKVTEGGTFNPSLILKTVSFVDSKEKSKKFILVKAGGEDNNYPWPIADSYITDEDLSKNTAIKIPQLSGENTNLGYVSLSGEDSLLISVSPGPGKKYIIVYYQIGDDSRLFLLDENGKVNDENIVGNTISTVKDKCMCGFQFDNWKDQDEFYVRVPTAVGETYRFLIDATTGKIIGGAEKI
jgi:hypothetical protein